MLTGRATGRSCSDNSSRTHHPASESGLKQPWVASSWDCPSRLSANAWFVALGIVLFLLICAAGVAEPIVKNVLVLHNWSNLPPSWAIMESTVRARVPGQINFYTASVENPRFDDEV